MSKKSRKRNKKILGLLGVLGAGLMASRKPKQSSVSADSGRGSGLRPTVDDTKVAGKIKSMIKPKRKSILADPRINKMDLSEVDLDYMAPDMSQYRNMDMGLEGYFKKGGRVRKTKKGGRAVKKASRSKKK
tara:strand:+ start:15 stop:407 length:393 start_codon:yes stop_codon:yes gene_type:complete